MLLQENPGTHTANTESYNGSSWTEATDLSTARRNGAGSAGPQTAALFFGGNPFSANPTSCNRVWNGTNWTAITGT